MSQTDNNAKLDSLLNNLKSLIGLEEVKKVVRSQINLIKINQQREAMGIKMPPISKHMIFTGNPGTGKTTVANLVAQIFKELGILSSGHLIEAKREDLVAEYVGQTAPKAKKVIDSALNGILFIDEAYRLVQEGGRDSYGKEAIDTLLTEMENNRDKLIVIVAGYPKDMERFINSNPGLQSRFNTIVPFEDYTPDELYDIFMLLCQQVQLSLTLNAEKRVKAHLKYIYDNRNEHFGNARDVRNMFEKIIIQQANRVAEEGSADMTLVTERDLDGIDPEYDPNDTDPNMRQALKAAQRCLEELNQMIGLASVKSEVQSLFNEAMLNKIKTEHGMKTQNTSLHMVFTGNPGTGKTTVAKIVSGIYKGLGLLSKGHLVEASRKELVAGYTGQTAIKTDEVINKSIGGVLFIDEAYSLKYNEQDNFGQEAIDTLIQGMENNRSDLVVILAGYPDDMDRFLEANVGFKSRINRFVHFDDYTPAELTEIFESMMRSCGYQYSDERYSDESYCHEFVLRYWTVKYHDRDKKFGNGRDVRNYFERTIKEQSNLLANAKNPNAINHYYNQLTRGMLEAAAYTDPLPDLQNLLGPDGRTILDAYTRYETDIGKIAFLHRHLKFTDSDQERFFFHMDNSASFSDVFLDNSDSDSFNSFDDVTDTERISIILNTARLASKTDCSVDPETQRQELQVKFESTLDDYFPDIPQKNRNLAVKRLYDAYTLMYLDKQLKAIGFFDALNNEIDTTKLDTITPLCLIKDIYVHIIHTNNPTEESRLLLEILKQNREMILSGGRDEAKMLYNKHFSFSALFNIIKRWDGVFSEEQLTALEKERQNYTDNLPADIESRKEYDSAACSRIREIVPFSVLNDLWNQARQCELDLLEML